MLVHPGITESAFLQLVTTVKFLITFAMRESPYFQVLRRLPNKFVRKRERSCSVYLWLGISCGRERLVCHTQISRRFPSAAASLSLSCGGGQDPHISNPPAALALRACCSSCCDPVELRITEWEGAPPCQLAPTPPPSEIPVLAARRKVSRQKGQTPPRCRYLPKGAPRSSRGPQSRVPCAWSRTEWTDLSLLKHCEVEGGGGGSDSELPGQKRENKTF